MHIKIETIPDTESLQQITTVQALHYKVVPFRYNENCIWCYTDEAHQSDAAELEFVLGKKVDFTIIDKHELSIALSQYYRRDERIGNGSNLPDGQTSWNSKQLNLDKLLEEAKTVNASDIHVEPYEHRCRIRFRIDGIMIERYVIPVEEYPALINKIKIRANLDIAEKRLPQDGRIFLAANGYKFDIRVSSLPTLYGEKIVMRLLSGSESKIDIHNLGFGQQELEYYLDGVNRPDGMVLISGPTGSGKTTTLYATLHLLNNKERNILTIEDPIEYTLEGVNQVQLREAIGLNFVGTLRTFLRQDPDIIMVGEIRDAETAGMAIRASLTGHLVFSTIHTNSAWGIVARLVDMGIPPYLLADTLNMAVAQRLVRRLCPHCKVLIPIDRIQFPKRYVMPFAIDHLYEPKGCEHCFFTGYKGRRAIYEVVPIDNDLSDQIKAVKLDVGKILEEKEIVPLSTNAFKLLASGETGIREVYPILTNAI
jgi:type IV pilus assembly protein PilB